MTCKSGAKRISTARSNTATDRTQTDDLRFTTLLTDSPSIDKSRTSDGDRLNISNIHSNRDEADSDP